MDRYIASLVVPSTFDSNVCFQCKTDFPQLYACGNRCNLGIYCSVACQKKHWNTLHKSVCIGVKLKRERSENNDESTLAAYVLINVLESNPIYLKEVVRRNTTHNLYLLYDKSPGFQRIVNNQPKFWYWVLKYHWALQQFYNLNLNYKAMVEEKLETKKHKIDTDVQYKARMFVTTGFGDKYDGYKALELKSNLFNKDTQITGKNELELITNMQVILSNTIFQGFVDGKWYRVNVYSDNGQMSHSWENQTPMKQNMGVLRNISGNTRSFYDSNPRLTIRINLIVSIHTLVFHVHDTKLFEMQFVSLLYNNNYMKNLINEFDLLLGNTLNHKGIRLTDAVYEIVCKVYSIHGDKWAKEIIDEDVISNQLFKNIVKVTRVANFITPLTIHAYTRRKRK